MSWIKTKVLREPWDVDPRLRELGLDREGLLEIRAVAIYHLRNATPYHCANAAGTFAYQHGTFALRHHYVGKAWSVDRADGVESIINGALKLRVIFSNVDLACDNDQMPKPRSQKGAGAERVCIGNLFEHLPHYAPRGTEDFLTFYLMVDEIGAAELTRPIVSDGTFSAYLERIYLSDGKDLDGEKLLLDDDSPVDKFDPQVVRK